MHGFPRRIRFYQARCQGGKQICKFCEQDNMDVIAALKKTTVLWLTERLSTNHCRKIAVPFENSVDTKLYRYQLQIFNENFVRRPNTMEKNLHWIKPKQLFIRKYD